MELARLHRGECTHTPSSPQSRDNPNAHMEVESSTWIRASIPRGFTLDRAAQLRPRGTMLEDLGGNLRRSTSSLSPGSPSA